MDQPGLMAVSLPSAGGDTAITRAFSETLAQGAEGVLLTAGGWFVLATTLSILGARRGDSSAYARMARRIAPSVLRRIVVLAVGGAIVLGPAASPASATSPDEPDLTGLRLPDRPSGPSPASRQMPQRTDVRPTVRVRSGDTLWDIASARLPRAASNAERAISTRRWHAANREVIGADPDRLLPGMHLNPPPVNSERTMH